ncbi:MAG: hypothetical protein ACYCY7_12585 [Gallionella sp.]
MFYKTKPSTWDTSRPDSRPERIVIAQDVTNCDRAMRFFKTITAGQSLFIGRFIINSHRPLKQLTVAIILLTISFESSAFWLLGFSDANTLPTGALGMIAGTGAQYANVGNPAKSSSTVFLAHAGFRYGLSDNLDIGYRLAPVALPYSSVGPTLGSEIDLKYRFTRPGASWQGAFVAGGAYSYLDISGQSKSAWSPGFDFVFSKYLNEKYTLITEARYLYIAIPTALGGSSANNLSAFGPDIGLKIKLTDKVSLVPELGIFNFRGNLLGAQENGRAVQIGAVLSARIW